MILIIDCLVFFFWGGGWVGRRHKTILRPDRKFNTTDVLHVKTHHEGQTVMQGRANMTATIWITNLSDRHRTSRATERRILGHFNGFFMDGTI